MFLFFSIFCAFLFCLVARQVHLAFREARKRRFRDPCSQGILFPFFFLSCFRERPKVSRQNFTVFFRASTCTCQFLLSFFCPFLEICRALFFSLPRFQYFAKRACVPFTSVVLFRFLFLTIALFVITFSLSRSLLFVHPPLLTLSFFASLKVPGFFFCCTPAKVYRTSRLFTPEHAPHFFSFYVSVTGSDGLHFGFFLIVRLESKMQTRALFHFLHSPSPLPPPAKKKEK